MIWLNDELPAADVHGAFRGSFLLKAPATVSVYYWGASWFRVWLDGTAFGEGPLRFEASHPEWEAIDFALDAGPHCLAAHVQNYGVATRILENIPAFFSGRVLLDGREIAVQWRALPLSGHTSGVRRLNPQLAWAEWCDTREEPEGWTAREFDDSRWAKAIPVQRPVGTPRAATVGQLHRVDMPLPAGVAATTMNRTAGDTHAPMPTLIAQGEFATNFGYEVDDPPVRFFLRELEQLSWPAQGVWRRYDLGRVRLGMPQFTIAAPPGAVIEIGLAEYLARGRVDPHINLSAGQSCNLDRFVARGGLQTFFPLTPKGGRYLEIHVEAPPDQVHFRDASFVDRSYCGAPDGSFECDDALLNRIWRVGVETYRACAEDAVTDNPTRERGEWLGDVGVVGMGVASVAYRDLRLIRRGLVRAAEGARDDGLVPGMTTGEKVFLSSYAAQWVTACRDFVRITGDRALLREIFEPARRNLAALDAYVTDDGLTDDAGWAFVDWGYVRNEGPVDIGLNLHYLEAVRSFVVWCDTIGEREEAARWSERAAHIEGVVQTWFDSKSPDGHREWPAVGYHRAALALRLGFVPDAEVHGCLDFLKSHIMKAFPNNLDAPRQASPSVTDPGIITPYFAHFVLPLFVAHGEIDFVLDQHRRCWGWMLEHEDGTWLEVFDTRWSHCHQWSGCPTWQLSRFVLGLHPRFDIEDACYDWNLAPGSLARAKGTLPVPGQSGSIEIAWSRDGDSVEVDLVASHPILVRFAVPHDEPRIERFEGQMHFRSVVGIVQMVESRKA